MAATFDHDQQAMGHSFPGSLVNFGAGGTCVDGV